MLSVLTPSKALYQEPGISKLYILLISMLSSLSNYVMCVYYHRFTSWTCCLNCWKLNHQQNVAGKHRPFWSNTVHWSWSRLSVRSVISSPVFMVCVVLTESHRKWKLSVLCTWTHFRLHPCSHQICTEVYVTVCSVIVLTIEPSSEAMTSWAKDWVWVLFTFGNPCLGSEQLP